MDSRPIQVNIFGKEYTLKSDVGEEHIKNVARYLDEKMKMFAGHLSKQDPLKIAVLSALNIADELFRERKEKELRQKETDQELEEILETVSYLEKELKIVISE